MTYTIAEPCVDVKNQSCVDVCPVSCIYIGDEAADVGGMARELARIVEALRQLRRHADEAHLDRLHHVESDARQEFGRYRELFQRLATNRQQPHSLFITCSDSRVVPNLITIYGGKFTTYRALCEGVGDRIADRLKCARRSGTREQESWFLDELRETEPGLFHSYSDLRHG